MTKNVKKAVVEFKRKFNIDAVSETVLCEVLEKQGFTVIGFNKILNDEDVSQIIKNLSLTDMIACHNGFTYADDKYRLVFVNKDLSEEEKTIVLAHEEGHIFLEHLSTKPIFGSDVVQEHQANEFAHFLLHPGKTERTGSWIKKHKKLVIIVCACILLAAEGITVLSILLQNKNQFGEYYLSATGNKYHDKNCIYVKNKENVRLMTEEEFESGEYEPCQVCMPRSDN